MNDLENSILLAKAMGLKVMNTQYGDPAFWRGEDGKLHAANFYSPSNMPLALRAIQWGYKHDQADGGFYDWMHQPVELWRSGAVATLIRENGIREALDVLVNRLIEVDNG